MADIKAGVTALDKKLGWKEKYGYGLGDFAFNFVYQGVSLYLTIFYTDVVGLAPVAVSVLFMVARVWDAINDPIMGSIIDRTNTKDGRFRPYLKWFAVPFGVSIVLCFLKPPFGATGNLVYAYITYIAMGMICTALTCPYTSLAATMTQDSKERGELGVVRIIGGQIATLIVSSAIPLMLAATANTEWGAAGGYAIAMSICAVIGVIAYFLCFKVTKERYVQVGEKVKMTGEVIKKLILTNKPFVTLFLAIFFMHGYFAVASSSLAYYYTYLFGSLTGLSIINLVGAAATIVGLLCIPKMMDKIDKKYIALIGTIGCLIMPLYFQFCPTTEAAMWGAIVVRIIYGFFWAMIQGLVWGLVPDTIEYGQLRSGVRAEGIMSALQSFSYKAGMALAGIIPGFVLQATGYVANEDQTEAAMSGIRLLNGWIPFVLMAITILFIAMYPLTKDKYEDVLRQLREKKNQA